jgi:hypothetical protein
MSKGELEIPQRVCAAPTDPKADNEGPIVKEDSTEENPLEDAYDSDDEFVPWGERNRDLHPDDSWTSDLDARDDTWISLAGFIALLPALHDLVYACTNQVPPCLLDTLRQNLPDCRLHVRNFRLRSVHQHKDQLHDIDQDEYSLATYPSLHSIVVDGRACDSEGRVNYNHEAAMQIVGLNPGIALRTKKNLFIGIKSTRNALFSLPRRKPGP